MQHMPEAVHPRAQLYDLEIYARAGLLSCLVKAWHSRFQGSRIQCGPATEPAKTAPVRSGALKRECEREREKRRSGAGSRVLVLSRLPAPAARTACSAASLALTRAIHGPERKVREAGKLRALRGQRETNAMPHTWCARP